MSALLPRFLLTTNVAMQLRLVLVLLCAASSILVAANERDLGDMGLPVDEIVPESPDNAFELNFIENYKGWVPPGSNSCSEVDSSLCVLQLQEVPKPSRRPG